MHNPPEKKILLSFQKMAFAVENFPELPLLFQENGGVVKEPVPGSYFSHASSRFLLPNEKLVVYDGDSISMFFLGVEPPRLDGRWSVPPLWSADFHESLVPLPHRGFFASFCGRRLHWYDPDAPSEPPQIVEFDGNIQAVLERRDRSLIVRLYSDPPGQTVLCVYHPNSTEKPARWQLAGLLYPVLDVVNSRGEERLLLRCFSGNAWFVELDLETGQTAGVPFPLVRVPREGSRLLRSIDCPFLVQVWFHPETSTYQLVENVFRFSEPFQLDDDDETHSLVLGNSAKGTQRRCCVMQVWDPKTDRFGRLETNSYGTAMPYGRFRFLWHAPNEPRKAHPVYRLFDRTQSLARESIYALSRSAPDPNERDCLPEDLRQLCQDLRQGSRLIVTLQ